MLDIKKLSQLKKAINNGRTFIIKKHYIKPEFTGQRRKPSVIQTNGFYSIIPDNCDSQVNTFNNCKGSWIAYGKASDWKFENGLCKQYCREKEIWEIEFE